MDIINRFILLNKLKEKLTTEIDDQTLSNILQQLDKLNALNDNWVEQVGEEKQKKENHPLVENDDLSKNSNNNKLPKTFYLKTPLYQGQVYLSIENGGFCYKDDYDNIRLYDRTDKGLLKKVKKYS